MEIPKVPAHSASVSISIPVKQIASKCAHIPNLTACDVHMRALDTADFTCDIESFNVIVLTVTVKQTGLIDVEAAVLVCTSIIFAR